jgi:hypothetical protein
MLVVPEPSVVIHHGPTPALQPPDFQTPASSHLHRMCRRETRTRLAALPVGAGDRRPHRPVTSSEWLGTDISLVSKMLGHSSIAITADTDSHLLEGVGRRAAEAAEALVPWRPCTMRAHSGGITDQALSREAGEGLDLRAYPYACSASVPA